MLQLGNKITVGEPIYKFQNNHSVDFDGVDGFIQLGEAISYTQHTISTWVKVSDSGDSKTIIDARDASDDGVRIRVDASENIIYELNTRDLTSTNTFAGEWVHIVATYDGTTQKLYINGSLDKSATTSQTISTTTKAKIGSRNFSDRANEFLGKIDELAIWDRALTAAEVTEIYRIKYGANLVQNGRFDELGSDLILNGDFATSGNWSTTGGWSIANGVAKNDGSGGILRQSNTLITNTPFKVVFTVSNYVTGNIQIKLAPETKIVTITGNGTYTVFTLGNNSLNDDLQIIATASFQGSIDNVSVKQVDPNDRWTLGTGWAYGDGIASCDGTQSANTDLLYNPAFTTNIGKKFKITFTISNYQAGEIYIRINSGNITTARSSNGTFTEILTGEGGGNIRFRANSNFIGSVTNFMVEEQKYVATNLKLNSGNYKSADPVIVSTKSVDLDGGEEYLEVTKKDFLGTSDFTISLWIKPDTVTADNYFMGQYTDSNNRWYIRVRGTNSAIQFYSLNSSSQVINLEGGTPVANKWNHIAITADRDGNSKLYVNSVLSDTEGTSTASLTFTGNLEIGAFRLFSGYFDGTIDELGIFSSALSSDQVGELYNQGVPSNLATSSAGVDGHLTGYWKMGDGTLDEAPLIADQTNATLGSELVTNGSFDTDSDWSGVGEKGWSISNGKAKRSGYSINSDIRQDVAVVNGGVYKFSYTRSYESGNGRTNLYIQLDNANYSSLGIYTSTVVEEQTIEGFFTTTFTGNLSFRIFGIGDFTGTIDNLSLKQVNGNPAIMQNTPTIVTDAPLTKIRNYYRMGDGILDTFPFINDMIAPSLANISTTNLVTHSEDLSQWNKSNLTTTSGFTAPDGTNTAYKLTTTSDNENAGVHINVTTVSGTTYVMSGFFKNQNVTGKTSFMARVSGGTLFRRSISFDGAIATTSTYASTGTVDGIQLFDKGNGWYRFSFYFVADGTTTQVEVDVDRENEAVGNAIYFWGAMLEEGFQASEYIKTEGSTVSRTATVENVYGTMRNMEQADITNDVPS
jgi:hypothetical protein